MCFLHQREVAVSIYESTPALIDVKEPFPYGEFVLVLEGRVSLTHVDGIKPTFTVGEYFLVPKGWMGSWGMSMHYREMIVVETKAWHQTES